MYKQRIKIFLAMIVLVLMGLGGRLWYLQIVRGDYYREQAEKLLRTIRLLPAPRGRVLDRRGNLLALDKACYDFCLDYRFLTADVGWVRQQQRLIARDEGVDKEQAAERFARRAERTWTLARQTAESAGVEMEEVVARIRRRVERVRGIVGMDVREQRALHVIVPGLDEEMSIEGTVGASVRPSLKRWYPFGQTACHTIGLTGQVTADEQDRYNLPAEQAEWLQRMRSNYLPGDTIGKRGVEKLCEATLRLKRGYRETRRGVEGLEVIEEVAGEAGRDVHVTLDIEFQAELEKLMKGTGKSGCIVALSVPTGEVLGLVSWPGFDLNRYRELYAYLIADHVDLPLIHRAVGSPYPPGSTIKPVTALAGLGAGKISTSTSFECRGYLHTPSAFRCWIWKYRRGHGSLSVTPGLKNSCNVFFYRTGERLGAEQLCEWFRMFGFGSKPGSGLPEEKAGSLPSEQRLREQLGHGFQPADARFMAIGQGRISATPLQVANAMATVARDGMLLSPMLVLEGGPPRLRVQLPLAPEHLQAVQRGMYQVVNEPGGTAYKIFHPPGVSPDVEICGKTGTAQTTPRRVEGRIVRQGDTAWFAGYAPYRNPQIAFAVMIEYAGSGSANAGPVARELIRIWRQDRFRHLH